MAKQEVFVIDRHNHSHTNDRGRAKLAFAQLSKAHNARILPMAIYCEKVSEIGIELEPIPHDDMDNRRSKFHAFSPILIPRPQVRFIILSYSRFHTIGAGT